MPEGPEVRREADAIGRVLTGKKLAESFFEPAHLKPFARRLVGQEVVEVTTRGKALLIFFKNGRVLYSHNQLYGRWVVASKSKPPNTKRTLRVALTTDTHSALLYSATDVALLGKKDLKTHPYLKKLGPDVLSIPCRGGILPSVCAISSFAAEVFQACISTSLFLRGLATI